VTFSSHLHNANLRQRCDLRRASVAPGYAMWMHSISMSNLNGHGVIAAKPRAG
jgi:hypothetical protein